MEGQPSKAEVKARGDVCHHFVLTGNNRGEEGKGLRRDGRRNEVREGLNIPAAISEAL